MYGDKQHELTRALASMSVEDLLMNLRENVDPYFISDQRKGTSPFKQTTPLPLNIQGGYLVAHKHHQDVIELKPSSQILL
jgi:hypothetical protein